METDAITLPAYWASALINGDYSGVTPEEAKRIRAKIEQLSAEGWAIVSTEDDSEPRFTWSYDLYDPGADCSGGDVLDYVIIRPKQTAIK